MEIGILLGCGECEEVECKSYAWIDGAYRQIIVDYEDGSYDVINNVVRVEEYEEK